MRARSNARFAYALFVLILFTIVVQAQSPAPPLLPIVEANTRFAFKLFKQVVSKTPDKNVLIAPTGLSLTFGLLDNGSDPETRKEIESAFEFTGLDLAQINEGVGALRQELNLVPPGQERPRPFVMIVNRPFFFAIRHNSGQLLFLGAVVEP